MTSELVPFDVAQEIFYLEESEDKNQRFTLPVTDAWCREKAGVTEWDLDVAACDESHLAPKFYEECDNGLAKRWFGRVWCNPPFDNIEAWVGKAWAESERCDVIAMLLPSTRTEQKWFQEMVEPFRDGRGRWVDTSKPLDPEAADFIRANSERDPSSGCWEWSRYRENGYGRMRFRGKMQLATRVSHEAFIGHLGDLFACHICDNPGCVSPHHLFAGTSGDNARDRDAKRRQARGADANCGHLTGLDVEAIRAAAASGSTQTALATDHGVHCSTISRIINGKRWGAPSAGPVAPNFPALRTHFLPGRTKFGHPGNPSAVGVGSPKGGTVLLVWRRK